MVPIGRVVRTDAKVCHVQIDGRIVQAAPRGILFEAGPTKNPIAVGDLVVLDLSNEPASIESVEPRRNYLGRTASMHDPREQVLVANVDQLCIVGSLAKPGFSSNRTDRILAACFWHDIPAVLILNKIDLARPGELEALQETYAKAGVEVMPTSAKTGAGVAALRAHLSGKLSAFYGASGAGKSSLLNSVQPGIDLKVGKISKYWSAGKHTTTHSQLMELELDGATGWVVDTPGIRVFRLHRLTPQDLRGLFPEFARFDRECRYPDCSHNHEPECAVFDAVEAGEIAPSRYASYVEMLDELKPPSEEPEYVEPDDEEP